MRYDNYRNKVLRLSDFLTKVVKHRVLIGAICASVLAVIIALMVTIGLPGQVDCSPEFIYGDAYGCQAKAFLSKVHFAYSPAGSDQWSTEQPYLPGSYQVRAVGRSIFGKERPGKPTTFRILPLPLQVRIEQSSLVFGDTPTFLADPTKYGDQIFCDGFTYADLAAATTAVSPDVNKIRILDLSGNDVTFAYDLRPLAIMVTFQKRPLELLVESQSKLYDGMALTYEHYQILRGSLGAGDTINALFTGAQTEVGSSENTSSFAILHVQDGSAIDVTGQYDLTITPGTLTVEQIPLHITTDSLDAVYTGQPISCQSYSLQDPTALLPGHRIEAIFATDLVQCGTYRNIAAIRILDAQGLDMTHNYSITCQWGTIRIKPAPVTVRTESGTWVYDGQHHSVDTYTIEGLLPNHRVSKAMFFSITDVGTADNRVKLTITNQNGEDVTSNYTFDNQFGTLEITKRPVTFTSGNGRWIYDGMYHDNPQLTANNLVPGHTYVVRNCANIRDVGTKENSFSLYIYNDSGHSKNVTANYEITTVFGTLEVTKRSITVTTLNNAWIYDGTAHIWDVCSVQNLVPEHSIQLVNCASITDVGQIPNRGEAKVTNPYENDADVTANYEIHYVYGTLKVNPRPIIVAVWDTEKVYDGTPLYGGEPYVPADSPYPLVEGHTLSATVNGSRTDVGVSNSSISKCQIFDGTRDVTFNYSIRTTGGKIRVLQARILVTAASDAKFYDGTPLTNPNFTAEVLEGSMKAGDSVRATVSGSITDPGAEPNTITARVVNRYGQDVTANYQLLTQDGVLQIVMEQEPPEMFVGRIKDDQTNVIYLRQYSKGDFTGRGWTGAIEYGKTLPGGLSYNYLASIAIRNSGGYIHIAEFRDMLWYMLPYYMSEYGDYARPGSDTDYSSLHRDAYSLSYYSLPSTDNGFDYLKGQLGEYAPYEEEYRQFVHQWYLTIDEASRSYMQGIIEKEGFSLSDPQVILKIAHYIQYAATYNLEYDRALDMEENVAIAFLDQYKEGKCTHYATAATLLYRALGIPARYVEGFMLQTEENVYVDIMTPGHAWVEVYIDGVGWIQVEVTGPDPNGGGSGGGGGKPGFTITPSYTYKNYDGKALYPQQRVDPDRTLSFLLEQGYTYKVSISGQQLQPGCSSSVIDSFTLFDPSGKDVTEEFQIICEEGTLEVFEAKTQVIRVYLYQLQKYYDGSPLTFAQDDYEIIEMPEGVSLRLSLKISLEEPGILRLSELNQNFAQYASFTAYRDGKNITSNCRVVFDLFDRSHLSYIPICLDGRPLAVSSASQSKVDDGTPLSNSECFISQGSLIRGHRLVAKATGFLDTVGTVTNTIDRDSFQILDASGQDVTRYYDILLYEGDLTITAPLS